MASTSYKASAPGSLMLLGEHAVLHGKHALVCAVDKKIHVTLTPLPTAEITIESALGSMTLSSKKIKIVPPFEFVLSVIKFFKKNLPSGFHLKIHAEFSHKIGFGSSAAVTVATIAVLNEWLNLSMSQDEIIRLARKIIQSIQGTGSGADAAASVLGGIVHYRMRPYTAEKIAEHLPLTVVYCGYKTPTKEVIQLVEEKFSHQPLIFKALCDAINVCAEQGIEFLKKQSLEQLGHVMNVQQGLMHSLGVNNADLHKIIISLNTHPSILGAKISGSGLGDCVVALGETNYPEAVPVKISQDGVQCEKI